MRFKSIFMVGLMLLSVLAVFGMPNASAADKGYLAVDEEHGAMSNRYVNNGWAYYLGDDDITFSISVYNRVYEIWPEEYRIRNITAEITAQKDSDGNSVNMLDFSDGTEEVDYTANITMWDVVLPAFQADVVQQGVAGTYNLTIKFEYDYTYLDSGSNLREGSGTDTDSVLIRIEDGVTVGTEVRVFNEFDAIVGHYLYTGTSFQKVGILIATNVGKIGEVTATITLSPQTKSYITLDMASAYTSQISAGGAIYFKYRVDVKDGAQPGRYDATISVQYERWYGDDEQTTIVAQELEIEFIVDFTPLLDISSPESFTITQGSLNTNLTEVTLVNIGNTELKKIRVWIDIWNYFEQNDFFYQGDGGHRTLLPTEDEKEKLGKGETWQVDFMNINVFKYLPAGEHRLPLSYEGYYYDDGTAGGSSDYKLTNDNTYLAVKGEEIYIKVIVTDTHHDFDAECSSSINLGTKMDDVYITFRLENIEAVDLLYTTIKMGTSDGTNQLLINPQNPSSNYLETIEVPRFWAQTTLTFTVNADVAQGAGEGFYSLPIVISGVNANTKEKVTVTEYVIIRVNAEPPRLVVNDIRYPPEIPGRISAGKEFELQIDITNEGDEHARNVYVSLVESGRDSDVSVTTDFTPDVAKAEGMIEPFSTEISRIYIGDIAPGETKTVNYTVKVDKNVVKGKNYEMWVTTDYTDDLNRGWTFNTEISVYVKGAQPEPEPDYTGVSEPLIVGIFLIIIIFILAILWVKVVTKPRRRDFGVAEPVEDPEPTVRDGSVPPPPPTQPVESGAKTFKVCPACHKSVPANNVTCPHCGCAL